MISVLCAKAVGDALNEGIYDLQIVLKGYPFLHEELDASFSERCSDIMRTELMTLNSHRNLSIPAVRAMLQSASLHGYPVVDGTRFIGYIQRTAVEELLGK